MAFVKIDDSNCEDFRNDRNISLKAKGILSLLLSSNGCEYLKEQDIVNSSSDSRDSVRSGMKELIDSGYIICGKRKRDALGRLSDCEYLVSGSRRKDSDNSKSDILYGRESVRGKVYVISADGTGLVKVGMTTKDVESRAKNLQCGCPHNLSVVSVFDVDDAMAVESLSHDKLSDFSVRGEWFKCDCDSAIFAVREAIIESL